MIQGTTSDAGKSTVVAGLCRLFMRRGVKVAPFKPQNMALNSAVTADGGEIGRAQAVQAQAAGIDALTDMNPVLIKPNSDQGAQIIVHGRAIGNMQAGQFHHYKKAAMSAVIESHTRLCAEYPLIIVEGAGSPAEINLREGDIANMGFAEKVDCPVILVADIDRGGLFAHIIGTLELLSQSEQNRVVGFIINRFRGDLKLLEPALQWLEQKSGKRVIGVVPYIQALYIEAEDAIPANPDLIEGHTAKLNVVVPVLPRISNHTDFDPLRLHPQVDCRFVRSVSKMGRADLIVIPGSKNVRDDLNWLKESGWARSIMQHLRYGGRVIGICGGFQILGRAIHDPDGIEGRAGSTDGLKLLNMETTLKQEKRLTRRCGRLNIDNATVEGYEIHTGITHGAATDTPLICFEEGQDGAISDDRQLLGTYLHGLFDHHEALQALLQWAGLDSGQEPSENGFNYHLLKESELDRLATVFEERLDIAYIEEQIDSFHPQPD